MIRRSWVIYRRKSRQIVSVVHHRYRMAKEDLRRLNDYYEARWYAIQVTRTDTETGKVVRRYPNVELTPLPEPERSDHG